MENRNQKSDRQDRGLLCRLISQCWPMRLPRELPPGWSGWLRAMSLKPLPGIDLMALSWFQRAWAGQPHLIVATVRNPAVTRSKARGRFVRF
jgi:hypothetical protein